MLRYLSMLLLTVALAACGGPQLKPETPKDHAAKVAATEARLAGKTSISNSRHGPQAEYTTPDGKAFLWYPGNATVVAGSWKVRISPDFVRTRTSDGKISVTRRGYLKRGRTYESVTDVCFRYGENTYNPVTRTRGGTWGCVLSALYLAKPKKFITGDSFGLANAKRVPFVTDKSVETYKKLVRLSGADE